MKSLLVIFDVIDNSNKNTELTFVIVTESIFDEQFTSAVQIDDTKCRPRSTKVSYYCATYDSGLF